MTIPMTLVMRNLTRALAKKTDHPSYPKIARKIYGLIIAPSKDYPGFLAWFSREFDRLPSGMTPQWYLGAVRGLIGEFESERKAEKARGRAFVDGEKEIREVLDD